MVNELANYFYGQATHYNHPGWYFDIIVTNLVELNLQGDNIRPGRFILVQDYGAIFMRSGDNNMFILPYEVNVDNPQGYYYFYQDKYNLSGKPVNFNREDIINDTEIFENWLISNNVPVDLDPEEKQALINQMYITEGYKFISYTNPNVQIWKGGTGQIVVDLANTDFEVVDNVDDIISMFE